MKLSPVPVRPPLPSNLATWTGILTPLRRPRPAWTLGTVVLLAVLGDPQFSLALAMGGGVFWYRQRRRGDRPAKHLVGTVGLTTVAMVGTYGLLTLIHTGNAGLMLHALETLALAIALGQLWRQGRARRRQAQARAWNAAIAQLAHPDDRRRALALQRLTRWARQGLTPDQNQELAGCCRGLLAQESVLREAVLILAETVQG